MNGTAWNHQYLDANGIRVHYVRHGEGFPLVLLHGWPEFWYVWRKNIPVLAESEPGSFAVQDIPYAHHVHGC